MADRTTLRKLLLCPFFGDLPPWFDAWQRNIARLEQHGYRVLVDTDEDGFRQRVADRLGIVCPPMFGTGNIWDFRCALGVLYADELAGFDYWGHSDMDVVYGRVERFTTDEALAACDIFTDCVFGYIAGPWAIYRNVERVNRLFLEHDEWRENMESPTPTGWVEGAFTELAKSHVRLTVDDRHAFTRPDLLRMDDDRLMHDGVEVPFFHFRRSKVWPL